LKKYLQADYLGLIAIVGYVLFLPLKTRPDLATFVLLALGLLAVLSSQGLRPNLARLDYLVISLVLASAGISTVLSVDPARSARFLVYLCLNLFLLLLATSMVSRRRLQIIAVGLGLVGVVHLLVVLASHHLAGPAKPSMMIRELDMATLIVPNDAMILGLCLPSLVMASFMFRGSRQVVSWIAVALYILFSAWVSYLLQSKLTLLSLVAPLLVMAAVQASSGSADGTRKSHLTVVIGVFGLVFLLSASAWYFGNQSTTRLSLWTTSVFSHDTTTEMLFGAGPNTFLYDPTFGDSQFDKGDLIVPWVHNAYLEAFYDQGLFGLAGFLALTIIPITRAVKVKDRTIRTLLLASMITFCLLALFEITLTRRFCLAYLAIMYGLARAQTAVRAG
jgi:hypothetical protein